MRRFRMFTFVLAALALGGLVAVGGPTAIAQGEDGEALVGSWNVTITITDGPSFPSLLSLGDDGTLQVVGVPATASADGAVVFLTSTALGSWEATGPNSAILTFTHLRTDSTGQFLGTVTPHQEITLDAADGHTFTGSFVTEFGEPDGTVAGTATGTLAGTRIVATGPDAVATPTA